MSAMQEAIDEFTTEADEQIERISIFLGEMEKGHANSDTLNSIYRDIHTIKGSAQLFGFKQIGQIGHAMETSLDPIRKGKVEVSTDLVDALLQGLDTIVIALTGVKENGSEPDVLDKIKQIIPKLTALTLKYHNALPNLDVEIELPKTPPDGINPSAPLLATSSPADLADATAKEVPQENVVEVPVQNTDQKKTEATQEQKNPAEPTKTSESTLKMEDKGGETIRVHVGLLDNLMNLVGELVLIRNQVVQDNSSNRDREAHNLSQRLNVVTTELQNEVMKTRMQPIGNILTKFHRVVRDLSKELGKKIELKLEGQETELDKTLIEAVKDPLTHVVRNSLDHGLETPEERVAAGKPETGVVMIRSYHEGGQVIVEVSDDGRGLDGEKIALKAIEKGVLTQEKMERMNEREMQNLVFAPGFSTAEKVSNVSGRGVGMDVVKTNITRIGGMIELNSTPGKGTSLRLKIPLTLAIVPALVVRCLNHRFAIPQVKLVELLRLEQEDAKKDLQLLQGQPVYRLRGKLLPIVSLAQVLKSSNRDKETSAITDTSKILNEDGTANIVVLNADSQYFGLLVDDIEDSADIVVKPLAQFLKSLPIYSGATVMGDGGVALTLDVMGIADMNNLFEAQEDQEGSGSLGIHESKTAESDVSEFLLVDIGSQSNYAIPLTHVNRLEEFNITEICYSGEREVIKYRDSLLPIISVPDFLQVHRGEKRAHQGDPVNSTIACEESRETNGITNEDDDSIRVVVVKRGESLYGLRVDKIRDVIEIPAEINADIKDRKGILGNLIHNDNVIVILDTVGIIDEERRSFNQGAVGDGASDTTRLINERGRHSIVLAEDSNFFRKQIKVILEQAGYHVSAHADGKLALAELNQRSSEHYSAVVSDIEMPVMDGYNLAQNIRKNQLFAELPLVAVTTRFSKKDIEKGKQCGFNKYLEKLKSDELIETLDNILSLRKAA